MPVNAFLANTISSLSLGFRDILCLVLLNATIFAVCKKPGCMSFPHLGHFINECPLFNSNYLLLFYSVILNYSTTEREASIIMYYTQDQIDRANQAAPPKEQKAEPKKAKSAAKKKHHKTEGKRNAENSQKCSVYAGFRRFTLPQLTLNQLV